MAYLIDKDALVAEIKKLIDEIYAGRLFHSLSSEQQTALQYVKSIMSSVNTLEVKEVDLEKDVRQILSLYYEGIKHYDDIIKKEREENGGSDLAIKIMDGVVDARELGIQYVIDKLKAQKGE